MFIEAHFRIYLPIGHMSYIHLHKNLSTSILKHSDLHSTATDNGLPYKSITVPKKLK